MRSADTAVTVSVVGRNHVADAPPPGPLPAVFGRLQLLPVALLAALSVLITLNASPGPKAHDPAQRFLLVLVVCVPFAALLRRWPLPVLAAATAANAMIMAGGNATLALGILLGLASEKCCRWSRGACPTPNSPRRSTSASRRPRPT
jgi:hypothetical protein